MAVGIKMDFKEGTQENYDAVMADMGLNGGVPPHAIFHFAGPIPGGWRVIDVWETIEAYQAFAESRIMPLAQKHGIANPPEVEIWPVHQINR